MIFLETEVSSMSDMIKKWEELEQNLVEGNVSGGRKVNKGRRVSELSLKFEEGGPLSERGDQEGGNHTSVPKGRPSVLERGHPSAFVKILKVNSPSKGEKSACKLRKLNTHSKPSFKNKSQDLDTESRGGRDWHSSANRKPGVTQRSRQFGQ